MLRRALMELMLEQTPLPIMANHVAEVVAG
jgi:hypothetical protein